NCHKCHGEKKQNGKLRLDSPAALFAGGESGPAIVPGEPEKSRLIDAINYGSLEMPPDGRLKPEQIKLLTEWIKMGAPWPGSGDVALQPRKGSLVVTDADRQHWSFRPVVRPEIGHSRREWAEFVRNPIDLFILDRLAEKNLHPSAQAKKQHLIRRLSFDLTGLPPTADDISAFTTDERPDAYERLIDRLLASPQYGERWARHWLDVVRFAQSNGYERDSEKPLAWRYRDYVIRALNQDKPYDQFLIEQLAGDELDPVTDDSLSATGYYRLGVWDDEPDDGIQAKADEFDDIVSTTASAMLGLTLGCARCHDHKFDPLGQDDYYSFTAFFQNIRLYGKVADTITGGQPVDKEGIFRPLPSGSGETLCVREHDGPPPQSFVLVRGNAHTPGKEVQPRFVEVLSRSGDLMLPNLPAVENSSTPTRGRRLALAQWIASKGNPLTARVAANRLWQHHFGRGIVPTSSDFGHTGMKPSHPELLDHLASELVDGGWQLKQMQRAIVSCATYRQSSSSSADLGMWSAESGRSSTASTPHSELRTPHLIDPDNALLWRQNLRRLEAES
ncbi:MAG TPA: PSD1 and planctomycete cytochrome C domain-containing protein, partial [Pirellulaceae bacterium]|nr:PSD1 and planctomycete cytochrome C domain-containing protein [Pirellulaceae bacterium]